MLIATVPYVGKQLHLDPEPDPKLNYGSGSEHANNFGSGRIRIHNPECSVKPSTKNCCYILPSSQFPISFIFTLSLLLFYLTFSYLIFPFLYCTFPPTSNGVCLFGSLPERVRWLIFSPYTDPCSHFHPTLFSRHSGMFGLSLAKSCMVGQSCHWFMNFFFLRLRFLINLNKI